MDLEIDITYAFVWSSYHDSPSLSKFSFIHGADPHYRRDWCFNQVILEGNQNMIRLFLSYDNLSSYIYTIPWVKYHRFKTVIDFCKEHRLVNIVSLFILHLKKENEK